MTCNAARWRSAAVGKGTIRPDHEPVHPRPEATGLDVITEDGVEVYADEDVMGPTDLVLQARMMGQVLADELTGLRRDIEAGTGLAA